MTRQHTMTPARRAALRKAQLVSARKRRKKHTVRSEVKRSANQAVSYARSSLRLAIGHRIRSK